MLQIVLSKPEDGKWQCALCKSTLEQSEWLCNVTDSQGRASSFICSKHKGLTLKEIVRQLDARQDNMNKIKFRFIPSDGGSLSDGWSYNSEIAEFAFRGEKE